jgi:predicted MFS family arabinose efflux permease
VVAVSYVSTLWLQERGGLSPVAAGFALLPLSLGIVAGCTAAPRLLRRWSPATVTAAGLATAAVAALALAAFLPDGRVGPTVVALAGLGFGFGGQTVPVSLIATTVPGEAGVASAGYQMSGQLGGVLGLAAFTAAALSDRVAIVAAAVVLALAAVPTLAWRGGANSAPSHAQVRGGANSRAPAALGDDLAVDAHPPVQPQGVGREPQSDLHDHTLAGAERGRGARLPVQVG